MRTLKEGCSIHPLVRDSGVVADAKAALPRDWTSKNGLVVLPMTSWREDTVMPWADEGCGGRRLCTRAAAGKYVVQWRLDCEESAQIWMNCADVGVVVA